MSKGERFFIICMSLIFIFVGCFSIYDVINTKNKYTETTIGTVVDFYKLNKVAEFPAYFPIFEYEVEGEKYYYKSKISTTPIEENLGKQVTLKYNFEHPDKATTSHDNMGKSAIFIGFCSLGIVFLIIAIKNRRS